MSYTSKYTAEQIEDKLTEVFDSTLQTKEIELTSNGTTELTADAGFLGLKSVTVKTNVPQSGGGGEGLKVEYLDLTNVKSDTMPLAALIGSFGYCAKVEIGGSKKIISLNALYAGLGQDIVTIPFYACEINLDAIHGVNNDGAYVKNKEVILTLGLSQSDLDSIPRITKEEFYTI